MVEEGGEADEEEEAPGAVDMEALCVRTACAGMVAIKCEDTATDERGVGARG